MTVKQNIPEINTGDYRYSLPDDRIAKYPVAERDRSRLLVYRQDISQDIFSNLPEYIPAGSTMVFNNSRVIRARLLFAKATGAQIEIFCLHPAEPSTFGESLSAMRFCSWFCAVGNAKKWKDETLEKTLVCNGKNCTLKARKVKIDADFLVTFEWDAPVDFSQILEICGNLPVPPYLKRESEKLDDLAYQTVYSKIEGSVAAPTAGLHFTGAVLDALKNRGVNFEEITLHVGAGTFKPMKTATVAEHQMHSETFLLDRDAIERLSAQSGKLFAVGTTSVRMLESLYWLGVLADDAPDFVLRQWDAYRHADTAMPVQEAFGRLTDKMYRQGVALTQAATEIMIAPGYRFRTVNGLLTNFHQPQSTLILLVAAFVGKRWRDIYDYALAHGFRFLSYGDSSLLIP
jgi:S-adenosylmethionine:tRNA ribosyltransferase-isomerase